MKKQRRFTRQMRASADVYRTYIQVQMRLQQRGLKLKRSGTRLDTTEEVAAHDLKLVVRHYQGESRQWVSIELCTVPNLRDTPFVRLTYRTNFDRAENEWLLESSVASRELAQEIGEEFWSLCLLPGESTVAKRRALTRRFGHIHLSRPNSRYFLGFLDRLLDRFRRETQTEHAP